MQAPDPLGRLREEVLAAFGPWVDMNAPGLLAVLHSSIIYAHLDPSRSELVIDRRALLLATVAEGLEASAPSANTARWFADWLSIRLSHLDLRRICADVRLSEEN